MNFLVHKGTHPLDDFACGLMHLRDDLFDMVIFSFAMSINFQRMKFVIKKQRID